MATPKLTVPPSHLIRTKGPADVPISPSPSARIGPTGNIGASGPTTDKRGRRRCFRDGMPIGCIEMNAEVKELVEAPEVETPDEPKPIRRNRQANRLHQERNQSAQPQQQPRQEAAQPRNPQVQPSQRRPVPTDRLARETLRNVTDGDYSDRDRQQVSELAERVGEEGHRQAANRLQHAASHRGVGNARWQAERGTRRYLRDIGQIRDDPNRSAPVGERGTAPQEQIRQPAPDEQYAGGREPRQESSKEEYLQEKERRQAKQDFREEQQLREQEALDEEESSRSWQEALDDEEVHDVAEVPEEEPDYNYREEQAQFNQEAIDFGFTDPEDGGDAGEIASEIGIESPEQFQYLRDFGIENKQILDSIGGGSALEGAQTVVGDVGEDGIQIRVKHKYIEKCRRELKVDNDGNRYIHNDIFRLRKSAPKGTGLRVFEDEIRTAIESGYSYIETHAAGNKKRQDEWNGYITWAKFGYDQDKEVWEQECSEWEDPEDCGLIEKWNEDWPEAQSVQDIMAEEGGAEWWEEHGQDMLQAKFDLTEGSRSRNIFEAYIAAKKKKGEYLEGLIKSYQIKSMSNDAGVDPISMEEANDPVFDQIRQYRKRNQPGVPFQGPSGKWFVVRPEDNKVVPTKDPNAVEEEQPQADSQFQEDWNQVAEQAINEIEQADVSDYQYTAQEVAAEQDWHRQLIEWRGSGSEPAPQDAGIISRAISGFLNPVLGGVGYVDGLVREFAIPNQKDDITQGLLAELDRINPGGKANAIIASLVGWLFGAPAVEVVKKMPTVPTQEQPEEQPQPEQTEESQPLPDPEKNGPPTAIQQRMNADPEFAQDWERMEKKRQKHRKRAANAPKRLDKLTPEERQQRAERAYLKLQKKEVKRAQRSAKWWAQKIQKGEIAPMDILQDGELLSRHPELKEVALEKLKQGKDMSWLANDRGGSLVAPPAVGKSKKPTLKVNKGFIQENPLT